MCILFGPFQEYGDAAEAEKPSKQEYFVAKWLKANVPTKKTKFLNHQVEYFTGKYTYTTPV